MTFGQPNLSAACSGVSTLVSSEGMTIHGSASALHSHALRRIQATQWPEEVWLRELHSRQRLRRRFSARNKGKTAQGTAKEPDTFGAPQTVGTLGRRVSQVVTRRLSKHNLSYQTLTKCCANQACGRIVRSEPTPGHPRPLATDRPRIAAADTANCPRGSSVGRSERRTL